MEYDLVLEGKVVSSSGVVEAEVGVLGSKIAAVKKSGLHGARRIKAGRALVFPGFVDVHTHLREPGWEQKEDFRTGTLAAAHGGVTTVADMPNNPVPAVARGMLELKRRLADSKGVVDIRLYGGVDPANPGNVEEIAPFVSAYKVYLARTTGDGLLPKEALSTALTDISATGRPVSFHCEDQSIIDRRTRELEGVKRPDVHCDVRPPEAEAVSVADTLRALEGHPGTRANICHISTEEAVSAVAAAAGAGRPVTCEAALHHLYYNRSAMLESGMLRTNPPLRGEEDRLALLGGLTDGRVQFLVTDHAPHTREEKLEMGLSGVPGLDDYGHVVSWLISDQGVGPERIASAAAESPSRFLGLGDRGRVEEGLRADLAVLDLTSPEVVRADDVKSKCGWSPYEGRQFPGRVRWTVSGGRLVVDDYEVVG